MHIRLVGLGFGLLALGCTGPGGGDTGWQNDCGDDSATSFEIEVTRVLVAPYDFSDEAWDWDGDIDGWWEDHGLWVELLLIVATKGSYEPGAYDELIAEADPYSESLFGQWVAPDLIVDEYFQPSPGAEWDYVGEWGGIPPDRHELTGLSFGTVDLSGGGAVGLAFQDEDIAFDDFIGDVSLDLEVAQQLAGCGPTGIVLTDSEMDGISTRLNAVEVEVVAR